MRLRIAIPEEHVSADVLNSGLEAVTRLDHSMMASGAAPTFTQLLKQGGVRWQPEPPGEEHFDHAGTVASRGWGDCDDLAPMRAAEMRLSGEDPGATARVVRSGPRRWHALVQRSDGAWEDPSREAGMGVAKSASVGGDWRASWETPDARVIEVLGGVDPACCAPMFRPNGKPALATFPASRAGGVYYARADLPWGRGGHALSGTGCGYTLADALEDAVAGVCYAGECAGIAEPHHVAKLMAARALATGADPRWVLDELAGAGVQLDPREWAATSGVGQLFSRGRRPGNAHTRW